MKPKKPIYKRVWFWIAVVVGLIVLSNIINGAGAADRADTEAPAPAAEQPAAEEPAAEEPAAEEPAAEEPAAEEPAAEAATSGTIGQPVEVGDWVITISGVGAPVATVGSQHFNTEAQGQFVPLSITVQNNGTEAQMFFAGDLVAIDDQGREFEYSSDAAIYSGDEGAAMLDEINPGNAMSGILYYDIPEGTNLVHVEISDGFFGQPVTIALQ